MLGLPRRIRELGIKRFRDQIGRASARFLLVKMDKKSQARLAKEEKVEQLTKNFSDGKNLVFWDYSGLSVPQFQQLRLQLEPIQTKVTVAKNSLISLALEKAKLKLENSELLVGPTAILIADDQIVPLKILFNFIKTAGVGSLKFGFLSGKFANLTLLEYLAILPPKEVVAGQIASILVLPVHNLVNILEGNLRNLVYVLGSRS